MLLQAGPGSLWDSQLPAAQGPVLAPESLGSQPSRELSAGELQIWMVSPLPLDQIQNMQWQLELRRLCQKEIKRNNGHWNFLFKSISLGDFFLVTCKCLNSQKGLVTEKKEYYIIPMCPRGYL